MADKKISELDAYTSPIDADVLPIVDTTTPATKKITWAYIKSVLKTYFDGLYPSGSGTCSGTNTGDSSGHSALAPIADPTFTGTVTAPTIKCETSSLISKINYAYSGGSANAYTLTLSPAPSAYVAGMMIIFQANFGNTGACTINVNSLGAKTIYKRTATNLQSGDIAQYRMALLFYNGSSFILINPQISI